MSIDQPRRLDRDRNPEGRPENARPRDRFGAPLPRDAIDELADRVEPATVCTDADDALRRAGALFDEERFFEAHEFFEWAWKGAGVAVQERPFWKGLAQLAVGYTHCQRGNAAGAATLLQRAVDALEPFGRTHHGVDVATLRRDAAAFRATLADPGASAERRFPRFAMMRAAGEGPVW